MKAKAWPDSTSLASARPIIGRAMRARPADAVAPSNFRLLNVRVFMTTSSLDPDVACRLLLDAFAQRALEPGHGDVHDDGQRREHEHRDPDQRDVVGLAGVQDLAAEAVLRGDEFADDGA